MENERTTLARHRTARSLLVAAVGLTRLAYERVGYVGLLCVIALPLALSVFRESSHSYRHRGLAEADPHARGGLAGLALVTAILAVGLP